MKNIWTMMTLLGVVFLTAACKNNELVVIPPVDDSLFEERTFEVVWSNAHFEDLANAWITKPLIYGEFIVYGLNTSTGDVFVKRNKQTGEIAGEWANPNSPQAPRGEAVAQMDNFLIVNDGAYVSCIDINSMDLIWSDNFSTDAINNRICVIDDYLYLGVRHSPFNDGSPQSDSTSMVRTKIDTPNWETLFTTTMEAEGGYATGAYPPAQAYNQNGEELIIFQLRQYNFSEGDGNIDIIAYNLDKSEVEWRKYNLTESGNSSIYQPLVVDNQFFFQGSNSIHCLDVSTGETIWERVFIGEGFATSNMIYVASGNRLILNGVTDNVFALNAATGVNLFENTTVNSANSGGVVYHKNKVYWSGDGTGNATCMSTSNGEVFWDDPSPHIQAGGFMEPYAFYGGINIDPETEQIYLSDRKHMMCIKARE